MLKSIKDKSILILGFGREGRDTLSFLQSKFPEKTIGVADQEEKNLNGKSVETYFGKDYLRAIDDYDVVIKSPGVPLSLIRKRSKKKMITSQTDIFLSYRRDDVIGVTGTKGKSTTCLSIYNILKRKSDQNVYLLGNIGEPVLKYLEKEGIFIYELSSFQLETVSCSPHISIFLNIFKDHLDQHDSFREYIDSKFNICKFQKENDLLIYNKEDKIINNLAKNADSQKLSFNPEEKLKNSAVYLEPIIKAVNQFNVSREEAIEVIENINFLPHRLEVVGEYKGVRFINDSAATIPEATIEAIDSLKEVKTLIVGGVDKGGDYNKLAKKIGKSDIKTLILFPETGKKIEEGLKDAKIEFPEIINSESMSDAVSKAYKKTSNGICLMSPASSSFNMFSSYKDRGNQFKKFVIEYGK